MSEHREHRRRAVSNKALTKHPHSAAALGEDVPKRRPSLASPLPPSPIVPSTPLPRPNPSVANHQRPVQQRPSTATSTSSSNLSDPPSTRGLMKRLLAKPAPPSSPSAPSPSFSMSPGFHHANTNEDDYERHITCSQDQDPPTDALLTPRSTNEFDKSIRALDLVGQIDISMTPSTTAGLDIITDPPGFANKQRNVFRQRPSGTAVTTPPVPTLLSFGTLLFLFFFPSAYSFLLEYPIGFGSIDDHSISASATPTPSTSPLPLQFPRCSSSSPTRHPTSKISSACSGSSLGRPKATHNHPTNHTKVEQSQVTPYYTILGDNSTTVGAGGSGDLFWDPCGEYEKGEHPREDGSAGSTRTLSGEWRKNDSDHQIRSKSSVHEFARSSVDKDLGMAKKLPDIPAGGSPSRRFWKLVKKFSINGLREKNEADSDHLPPVPPLPSHLTNDPIRTPIDSSLVNNVVSLSTSAPSPTTLVDKSSLVLSTPPSAPAQHRTKLSHSAPHSPPSQLTNGPRPSTTTRSSSPSSDVASSRFFNRQSARSSTSSLGEEAIPLPPLPESSISNATSKTNGKLNANDTNASLELQQHIVPPRKLSQNHSTSDLPCISPIAIVYPPPNMDDDWTIVRSPSVEFETVSLPPPPRQLLKGIGIGVGHKTAGCQGNKAKAKASDVIPKMLKMVNISSEHVEEKSHEVSDNVNSQENEGNIIEEITTSEQGDKEKSECNTDRDSNRSQSPTIPSFSTSSAINSFPARRVSSSLSARSRSSPIALSPDRSDSNPGSVLATANGFRSPSRSPQRPGSHTALGRVRQHLFGTNDDRVKAEEDKEIDKVLNPLLSSRKSDAQLYSSSSSGKTSITAKPRSTHTAASSVSMPASPTITYHRRSMSFNTSSPALPTRGLFTSPNPFSDAPRLSSADTTPHITPVPPPPVGSSLTSSMGHRTRTSSNLRSGFPSRKLSEVLFSSSSPARAPPSASSSHRTIGSLMSRSISIGASNHSKSNTSIPAIPSQPRTQLTDQEKTDKWNDLLARSARAGGTLHLAAGSRLLGSDEI